MSRKIYMILSMLLIVAFALSACGTPAAEPAAPVAEEPAAPAVEEPAGDKVTITWWHISTAEEHKAVWQKLADEYMAAHPNVNIEITVLENEAFKTKLTTVMQSGEPPDIFQSWGGGVMNEYANAGLLKDITADLDADGGAVYLDNGQLFTQWIFHKENLPASLEERFKLYIDPLVATYQALGINASHRPVNDVHVNGKKIGGTGAAQIGSAEVVVGSLMYTFDKKTMSQVLKVPSEKMRDKIFESLEAYMTTMTEQLGYTPDRAQVKDLYMQKVSEALGVEVYEGEWTPEEEAMAVDLDARFVSEEWLYQKGRLRQPGVKIHEDVHIVEAAFKAQGGLIRIIARLHEGRIDDVSISGDFTLMPSFALGALEQSIRGMRATPETLEARLKEAYNRLSIQSPGVTPADFTTAIMNAVAPSQPV